ncbi:MAG: aminotransferase class V-fold PLP-dependent enzyme [Rhodobacterales bacterium]
MRDLADSTTGQLDGFYAALLTPDRLADLRAGLIGEGMQIEGPFGPRPLVYADYTASGRALMQVERFILETVLPRYANSHTEASFCGAAMTRLRSEARATIARLCGAGPEHAVIFCGAGATAGINRLVALLGADDAAAPVRVILGPYEHHSNILPWRESGAEIVTLPEASQGGPDRVALEAALRDAPGRVICAFSAASNITGITADVAQVTRQVKAAGAAMIWDYAGGGPYLPMTMTPSPDAEIDAIVVSPHKFVGGPAASGVMILRRDAVQRQTPTWPGGGTVRFVSPRRHDYSASLEAREEAGTPNVIGDIRAALAFLVKEAIGAADHAAHHRTVMARAEARLRHHPRIVLLGPALPDRLPILSFRLRDGRGGYVHQQLVTRLLSDRYGIQARGGCACAGPYVHDLLQIGVADSERLRHAVLTGEETAKPGFTRLNLSVLMEAQKVDYVLDSLCDLALDVPELARHYQCDQSRAIFTAKDFA